MTGSINIDDAATPGSDAGTWALPNSRYSWAAVVIPSDISISVNEALEIFISGVKSEYGVDELHFTDIYSGRGPYKHVAIEERIELFDLMFTIFENFDLPVIYQTCSEEMLAEWSIDKPIIKSWWDHREISRMGLLMLCFNVNRFMQMHSKHFPQSLPAFVDEGLAKEGALVRLPNWSESFEHQQLIFIKSHNRPEIQLADFAAFCIARSQWCLGKNRVSKGDLYFIKNAARINAVNLLRIEAGEGDVGRGLLEWAVMRDRKEKGLPRKFTVRSKK